MCCLGFICHQSNGQRFYEFEPQRGFRLSGRLLWLHRCQSIFHYSHFILIPVRSFDCERAREGRPRGHWWLIFWTLADCVSNGALIGFGPPSPQTSPPPPKKKSIQIPTRGAGEEKKPAFKTQWAVRNRPNVQFRIYIFAKKMCQSCLWWCHLNINKASAFLCGEETQIRGALTKDFPAYIQKNRVLATSLSIFIWCRMLRMRFNKVAQRLWSQVSLQSFHILSKSERKVWGIAERETWWRERSEGVFLSAVVAQTPADNTVDLQILLSWIQEFLHISQWNLLDIVPDLWPESLQEMCCINTAVRRPFLQIKGYLMWSGHIIS